MLARVAHEEYVLSEGETVLLKSLIKLYSIFKDSMENIQSMTEPTAHVLLFMKQEISEK